MPDNIDQGLKKQLEKLKKQNQERAKEIAVLEEKINTKQAKYATAAEKLTGETRAAIEGLRTDMAKRDIERDAETHRRDKDNLRLQIGLWVAAIVILGFIIRL